MRVSLFLFASLFSTLSLSAQTNSPSVQPPAQTDPTTIITTWGKEYDNIKVTKIDPDGLHISFPTGVAKIPFKQLSPELQKKYGYDPIAAKQFEEDQAQTQAQVDAEQAPKIAAELAQEKQEADSDQKQRLAGIAADKAKENADIAADQARILREQMKQDSVHGYDYDYGRGGNSGTYWSDKRESEQAALTAANAQLNNANKQLRDADKGATPPPQRPTPVYQPQIYQQNPPHVVQPLVQQQSPQPPAPGGTSSTTTVVTTTTTTTRQVFEQPATNQVNAAH